MHRRRGQGGGPGRGASADETPRSVYPGEDLSVRCTSQMLSAPCALTRVARRAPSVHRGRPKTPAAPWIRVRRSRRRPLLPRPRPRRRRAHRALLYPPHHRAAVLRHRESSLALALLRALPARRVGRVHLRRRSYPPRQVVQTMARVPGVGGVYEPLVVTPPSACASSPRRVSSRSMARRFPYASRFMPSAPPREPSILKLPEGWRADPAQQNSI